MLGRNRYVRRITYVVRAQRTKVIFSQKRSHPFKIVPDMKNIGCLRARILFSLSHFIRRTSGFSNFTYGSKTSTIAPTERKVFSTIIAFTSAGYSFASQIDTAPPRLLPNEIIEVFVSLLKNIVVTSHKQGMEDYY